MNPLTPAQQSNFYPITAWGYAWWRERSLSLLSGTPFGLEREAALFRNLCQPQAGQYWLDAGTSTGFYAGVLAECGCRVDAVDLSEAMLDEAKKRESSQQIHWTKANLESSSLARASYDGITVGATLNETARPALFLAEMARLLRSGGKLWMMYVPYTGGLGQQVLGSLGGLTFPRLRWVEDQLPELVLKHAVLVGQVQFVLFVKE